MIDSCRKIREQILKISHHSGHGHIPTCFSIVEMLESLYSTMNHDPKNPDSQERDIFILSKGHASLAMYCTLAQFGYFDSKDVYSFGAYKSQFGCHADRLKVPGVEASTGSLGHGIGLAVGMALGLNISSSARKVFTIIGDGESNEGTVWEAVSVAAHQKLQNLTILVDVNNSQTRCMPLTNPKDRFEAFGCVCTEVDGHNKDEIITALNREVDTAHVIVCNTVKGFGCQTLVDNMFAWHRRSPNEDEVKILLGELANG